VGLAPTRMLGLVLVLPAPTGPTRSGTSRPARHAISGTMRRSIRARAWPARSTRTSMWLARARPRTAWRVRLALSRKRSATRTRRARRAVLAPTCRTGAALGVVLAGSRSRARRTVALAVLVRSRLGMPVLVRLANLAATPRPRWRRHAPGVMRARTRWSALKTARGASRARMRWAMLALVWSAVLAHSLAWLRRRRALPAGPGGTRGLGRASACCARLARIRLAMPRTAVRALSGHMPLRALPRSV
jgi:hypothetical protein